MQLRYVYSELGQGLRRNLSMHLAVVLTLFVSLTLVGIGVLFNQQAAKAADHWGNQLQITVYLCRANDSSAVCPNAVTDAQKSEISAVVEDNPEVADFHFESSEQALDKARELYGDELFTGDNPAITAADMPQTIWITLEDPEKYEGITSAVQGLDGVSKVRDMREQVAPILESINMLQWVALGTAAFLVFAALLLVANTIRLAAFARRKEIGIMRLVGASTLYIALPFLLEALVDRAHRRRAGCRGAVGLHVLRHRRALAEPAEVRPVDRLGRVLARCRVGRDPRTAAHVAPDTRVDAEIPQSLIRGGLASRRLPRRSRRGRHLPRFPNAKASPGASLPPYRSPPHGRARRGHGTGRLHGPRSAGRRPQGQEAPGRAPAQGRAPGPRRVERPAAQGRRAPRGGPRAARVAKTRLATARGKVEVAREKDAQMQAELAQAEADLAAAEAALAQGQVDREQQRQRVADTVADMYSEGDPELIAFSSLLDAESTEELTRRDGVRDVVVGQEARAYDELRAAEVLLEVQEEQVSEARDDVAAKRQAAAEHLTLMQALETEQQAAKDSVVSLVIERRDARGDARKARARDLAKLRTLRGAAEPDRGDAPQAGAGGAPP